jgi:hypothetical protein
VKRLFALALVVGGFAIVGGVSADTGALSVPPEHDSYYTWPGAQLLQVSTVPWGAGFVQNRPKYYIDCPYACIRPFDMGASVTLTAVPSTGYTFIGWQVADHGGPPTGACPGTGTCTVTMSGAKDVVALFSGPPSQPAGVDARHSREQ